MLKPLSAEAQTFKFGVYRHYKGQDYRALSIARMEATGQEVVIYVALYGEGAVWVRPLKEFLETIDNNDEKTNRFTLIYP